MNAMPEAVLFDWDNTLVDTWPVIHESMNATLVAMGHPEWTMEETRTRVRRSMREAFPEMFDDRWEEARDIFYGRFDAIHLERLETCPGAEALIEALHRRGVYLGVVSNKMGHNLRKEAAYLGWERYFQRLVGASDAKRDKPDIAPVDLALSAGTVARGSAVWFVGDTAIDLECAYNAGCTGVLIRGQPPGVDEFGPHAPGAHFESCAALFELFATL